MLSAIDTAFGIVIDITQFRWLYFVYNQCCILVMYASTDLFGFSLNSNGKLQIVDGWLLFDLCFQL